MAQLETYINNLCSMLSSNGSASSSRNIYSQYIDCTNKQYFTIYASANKSMSLDKYFSLDSSVHDTFYKLATDSERLVVFATRCKIMDLVLDEIMRHSEGNLRKVAQFNPINVSPKYKALLQKNINQIKNDFSPVGGIDAAGIKDLSLTDAYKRYDGVTKYIKKLYDRFMEANKKLIERKDVEGQSATVAMVQVLQQINKKWTDAIKAKEVKLEEQGYAQAHEPTLFKDMDRERKADWAKGHQMQVDRILRDIKILEYIRRLPLNDTDNYDKNRGDYFWSKSDMPPKYWKFGDKEKIYQKELFKIYDNLVRERDRLQKLKEKYMDKPRTRLVDGKLVPVK